MLIRLSLKKYHYLLQKGLLELHTRLHSTIKLAMGYFSPLEIKKHALIDAFLSYFA